MREKMNTGKEINRPSDDPVGLQYVFSVGTSIKENEQYQENIDRILGRMNRTSSTLESVEELLMEISDVAAVSASDSSTSVERAANAQQVEVILEQLVHLANTSHQNKFIFGGVNTVSGSQPLSLPYNVQYNPNGYISGVVANPLGINTLVNTTILPGVRDSLNISGAAPFQPNGAKGAGDIFNVLATFRNNLLNNDVEALRASELQVENALNQVIKENTIVGSKIHKLEVTNDTLEATITSEMAEKSAVEDADYAKLLVEFSTQEV